jgi:Fe-S oxidoreductase
MNRRFAPGCALMLYKPHLAHKLGLALGGSIGFEAPWLTCCRKDPQFSEDTELVNICPGCDKRFRLNYAKTSTISLWEILARSDSFPFPDYGGRIMSIIDACPTRDQTRVHDAVRTLLARMNIALVEPKATKTKSVCCGDSYWGEIPTEKVKERMRKRTVEMPAPEVVVYCVSCVVAVTIGGKKPRYLVDLLFGEDTEPRIVDLDVWHAELQTYIDAH